MVSGTVTPDDGTPTTPYLALGLLDSDKGYRPPPFWNHTGGCCKPTERCHAYVKWMLDMQNQDAWEHPEQKAEANSHVECCMRQYRASCEDPMEGDTVIWRDPSKSCSPDKKSVEERTFV